MGNIFPGAAVTRLLPPPSTAVLREVRSSLQKQRSIAPPRRTVPVRLAFNSWLLACRCEYEPRGTYDAVPVEFCTTEKRCSTLHLAVCSSQPAEARVCGTGIVRAFDFAPQVAAHYIFKKNEKIQLIAVRRTKMIFDQNLALCMLSVIIRSRMLRGVYTLQKDTGR